MNDTKNRICFKCQSAHVMYPVEIAGDAETPIPLQLKVKPPKEEGAWLSFRYPDRITVSAAVCGECGHTELYAEKPQEMWAKWQKGFR